MKGKKPQSPRSAVEGYSNPIERTREVMRRLAEMPHKPHVPSGKRARVAGDGYRKRQTYTAAVDALATLLSARHIDDDLAVRTRRLFENVPSKMFRIVMQERPATRTTELGVSLEPSDFLLRLIAAVDAGDANEVRVLEHELCS